MTDQTLDLDAIEARARAATPGPWFVRPRQYDDWGYIRGPEQSDGPGHFVAQALGGQDYTIDQLNEHRRNKTDPYGHNAAHIAGMDPATTLALTAEVRKLREAAATALGNLDDPTGGEHVADMRAAAAVLLKALKTKEPSA